MSENRPTFQAVLAEQVVDEVAFWITAAEKRLTKVTYKAFLDSLPTEAGALQRLIESAAHAGNPGEPDALLMVMALADTLGWPVNTELVRTLDDAITFTRHTALRRRTVEWVMKTGVRAPVKVGESARYQPANRDFSRAVTVIEIDKPIAMVRAKTSDDEVVTIPAERLSA